MSSPAHAVAWSLAGLGLLVWPGRTVGRRGGRRAGRRTPATAGALRMSQHSLQAVLCLCVSAVAVSAFGFATGAALAVAVAPVAAVVLARAQSRPRPGARSTPDHRLALCLDLIAAALRSGRPVPVAVELAAPAAGAATAARLAHVAGLLRLGADPALAWRTLGADEVLAPVAQAAARSADSGVRLARGLEQAAEELRSQLRAAAEARAHRAGVLAMLPLGFCFLPAFVCLGVVPVVIGIARGVLTGLA